LDTILKYFIYTFQTKFKSLNKLYDLMNIIWVKKKNFPFIKNASLLDIFKLKFGIDRAT